MGDAKRKRQAQEGLRAAALAAAETIDQARAAAAVRQIVGAITDFHGADCLLYAHIGAELLRSMGLDAKPAAGSAAWRVGSGGTDVISHAREINGMQFSQAEQRKAAMFHAWIEAPGLIIDFSTCTLRAKAAQLDAADGGHTTVDWAPDFVWVSTSQPASTEGTAVRQPRAVLMAPDAGVFNYTRHADIEAITLECSADFAQSLATAVFSAQAAYAALGRGDTLKVIGVSLDGDLQEEPQEAPLQRLRP